MTPTYGHNNSEPRHDLVDHRELGIIIYSAPVNLGHEESEGLLMV
jgi:hypothetical protein